MRFSAVLLTVVLAALSGPPALAAHSGSDRWELAARDDHDSREEQRGSRRDGSRDKAVRRAQREHGGRVLSVDRVPGEQQRERYRIKLLSKGNVRTVDVEAQEED